MKAKIYYGNLDEVLNAFRRFQDRAGRWGENISLNIGPPRYEEIAGTETAVKVCDIEYSGVFHIGCNDYIGKIERDIEQDVWRKVSLNNTIKDEDIPKGDTFPCAKCGHMIRKEGHIFQRPEGTRFIVGSSCVKLFDGGVGLDSIMKMFSVKECIKDFAIEYYDDDEDLLCHSGGEGRAPKRYYDVSLIIGLALNAIKENGYTSSKDETLMPTSLLVRSLLYKDDRQAIEKAKSEETQNEVKKIRAYWDEHVSDYSGEYFQKVELALHDGYISEERAGVLCYLPVGYYKNQIGKSSPYGKVGERFRGVDADIQYITKESGIYGDIFGHIIRVGKDVLEYFGSKRLNSGTYKIDFTVKKHILKKEDENITLVSRVCPSKCQ